jgi:hypothetical protein
MGRSVSKTMVANPLPALTSLRDQPGGASWTQGTRVADGTAWAISHSASWSEQPTSLVNRELLVRSVWSAQVRNIGATTSTASRTVRARPKRRRLKRWMEMGVGRSGSRSRNSACRSRPFSRSMWRSWEGMANPRVAANPSLISWTENWRRARS